MARKITIEQFAREAEQIIERLPQAHLELQAELVGHAIDQCVERSPVLTGAYRASHTVLGPGGFIYEGEERVGDDEQVPTYPLARYKPANGSDAARDVRQGEVFQEGEPFQRLEIRNGRFYASTLEFGSPTTAPRAIYESASVSTEDASQRISRRAVKLQPNG